MKHVMDGIVAIDKNDVNLSNANMSSHTPAGQMMTFASEVTKDYTYKYLLPKRFAEAHQLGDIHIHDLDYYPTKTTTCIQYDMDDLFERGFRTKNGSIRTPQSIQSYATLATIIFQTNQNEQHGGQAIPAFDFFMAKGVAKSFRKHLASFINFYVAMENGTQADEKAIRTLIKEHLSSIKSTEAEREALRIALIALQIIIDKEHLTRIAEKAYQRDRRAAESYHRRTRNTWRSARIPHSDIQGEGWSFLLGKGLRESDENGKDRRRHEVHLRGSELRPAATGLPDNGKSSFPEFHVPRHSFQQKREMESQ